MQELTKCGGESPTVFKRKLVLESKCKIMVGNLKRLVTFGAVTRYFGLVFRVIVLIVGLVSKQCL